MGRPGSLTKDENDRIPHCSGRHKWEKGQGSAKKTTGDPAGSRCQRGSMHSTVGLGSTMIPGDASICIGGWIREEPASIQITGVGAGGKNESKVQYKALLKRRDGSIAEFNPYGVDKITGNAISMNLDKARALFPFAARELESPAGPVQMLIRMDQMENAPWEEDRAQGVAMYRSEFGTGIGSRWEHELPARQPGLSRTLSEGPKLLERAVQPPRVHTSRSHGNGGALQVPRLQELQGVPVPHGQSDFQGKLGVQDHTEQATVGCEKEKVGSRIPLQHHDGKADRQLQPGEGAHEQDGEPAAEEGETG
jgi:hypothetical protein